MVGELFSITSDIKSIVTAAFDDLLINEQDGGLGKTCLLVYPPKSIPCENCLINPTTGKSIGRYRHGGPAPFKQGRCPLCQGEGRKSSEATEEITFGVNWDVKTFVFPIQNIDLRVPHGFVQTKGYLKDAPKVLKADHLVIQLPIAPYLRQKFKLEGEPVDTSNIVQGRYFYALWRRWNG